MILKSGSQSSVPTNIIVEQEGYVRIDQEHIADFTATDGCLRTREAGLCPSDGET